MYEFMEGRWRKQRALSYAEVRAKEWLGVARKWARRHCHKTGQVTMDDVVAAIDRHELPWAKDLNPNLRGQLFRAKDFIPGGQIYSKRANAHMNRILVWRLRGEANAVLDTQSD